MKIFDKVYNSNGQVTLTRKEVEQLKKYLLVQLYRNPTNMQTYSPNWEGDLLGLNKTFKNDAESKFHVSEQIRVICEKSWGDLCNIDNIELRANIHALKDTKTLFVKSPVWDFVINDLGSVCERQVWGRRDRNIVRKDLEAIAGAKLPDEIIDKWMVGHRYFDNFTFFPISSKFGIITISPEWSRSMDEKQAYEIAKPKQKGNFCDYKINMSFFDWMLAEKGLHSWFIRKNFLPCINSYASEEMKHATQENLHELLAKHRSPDDLYIYPVVELDMESVEWLNCLTINETDTFLGFGSNSVGKYYLSRYADGANPNFR